MGRARGLNNAVVVGSAPLVRRAPMRVNPGSLAPMSTGWLETHDGYRASVNLTMDGDGNLHTFSHQVAPGTRGVRKTLYFGDDLRGAVTAANHAIGGFRAERFRPAADDASDQAFTETATAAALGLDLATAPAAPRVAEPDAAPVERRPVDILA